MKVIKIKSCKTNKKKCPYCDHDNLDFKTGVYYCFHEDVFQRRIDDVNIIPDWCPLENLKEEK